MKQRNLVIKLCHVLTVVGLIFSTTVQSETLNEFRIELLNDSGNSGQEYFVCNYNEFIATGTTGFEKLLVECDDQSIRPHILFATTKGGANFIFNPEVSFTNFILENANTPKELLIKFPNNEKEWFFCNFTEYSGEPISGVDKLSVVCQEESMRSFWVGKIKLDAVETNQVFAEIDPIVVDPIVVDPIVVDPIVVDNSGCPAPDFQRTRTLEAFIPDNNPIYQEQRLVNTQLNRSSGSLETESVYVIPFTTQNRAGVTSRFDMAEHPALTSYVKTVTISKCPGEFKRNPDSYVKGAGGACSITVDSINMRFTTSDSEGEDAMSDTYANCVLSKNTQYYINLHPVSGTRFSDAQDGTVFSDDQITCKNKFGKPDPDCRDNGVMFAIRQLGS